MKEATQGQPLPQERPARLCIVVEDENLPTIVFKGPYNNLIAHSGEGRKTNTPYTSIYTGYNSVTTAIETGREKAFKELISHEARDIIRGYHVDEETEDMSGLYGSVLLINAALFDGDAVLKDKEGFLETFDLLLDIDPHTIAVIIARTKSQEKELKELSLSLGDKVRIRFLKEEALGQYESILKEKNLFESHGDFKVIRGNKIPKNSKALREAISGA
ncbi:MAG: hypothetical protein KKA34_02125 [Candidatus Omnitrophica bacterium]|nr:hypothetical protein [Candidatus Omnitrophota bacterium]